MTQDAAGYARQIIRKPAGDKQMMEKCKRNPLEANAGLLGVKLEEETLNAPLWPFRGSLIWMP